jgi:two-component system KDP operon response regulator KdpE
VASRLEVCKKQVLWKFDALLDQLSAYSLDNFPHSLKANARDRPNRLGYMVWGDVRGLSWGERMDALLVHTSVVEDVECAIRLGWDGATLLHAASPGDAVSHTRERKPNLIVIDEAPGTYCHFSLSKELRGVTDAVIVITTRRYDEYQLAAVVDAGADDYIALPVNPAVFVPRIRAAIRRADNTTNSPLTLGKLELDASRYVVQVAGQEVRLAASEFKVLTELVRCGGRVATREALANAIWGDEHSVYIEWLRKYIQSLRRRVCEFPGSDIDIVTVPRVGYRLVASSAA